MGNQANSSYIPVLPKRRVNLTTERVKRGMSAAALGRAVGVKPNAVRNWEKGVFTPDATHLILLSKLFGKDPEYLLQIQEQAEEPDDA